jgi:hypothetical protein
MSSGSPGGTGSGSRRLSAGLAEAAGESTTARCSGRALSPVGAPVPWTAGAGAEVGSGRAGATLGSGHAGAAVGSGRAGAPAGAVGVVPMGGAVGAGFADGADGAPGDALAGAAVSNPNCDGACASSQPRPVWIVSPTANSGAGREGTAAAGTTGLPATTRDEGTAGTDRAARPRTLGWCAAATVAPSRGMWRRPRACATDAPRRLAMRVRRAARRISGRLASRTCA